jgi:hypothetical protein
MNNLFKNVKNILSFFILIVIIMLFIPQSSQTQQRRLPVLTGMTYPKAPVYDTAFVSKQLYDYLYEQLEVGESITLEIPYSLDVQAVNHQNQYIEEMSKELLKQTNQEEAEVKEWNEEGRLIPENESINKDSRDRPQKSGLGYRTPARTNFSTEREYIPYEKPTYEKISISARKKIKPNGDTTVVVSTPFYLQGR